MTWNAPRPDTWVPLRRTVANPCGFMRHDWDDGHDPAGGCDGYTVRYTCRTCGLQKDRGGG
jgi:hypothetical protein